jgi:hypothetical protein
MKNKTVEQLARIFSKKLQSEIGNRKLHQVIRLNSEETNPAICHSHDFCDANMIMNDAFKVVPHRNAHLPGDSVSEAENDVDDALWTLAWSYAKRMEFHFPE